MDGDETFELDLPAQGSEPPAEFKERPYIKVYLPSALTGYEGKQGFDDEIRRVICEVFSKAEYATGDCRLRYRVYNPAEHTRPGTAHRPEQVYEIDFKELVESDFALFYLNSPSLGVGIERQIAAMGAVQSAVTCATGQEVSRMFEGVFSGSIFKIPFAHPGELEIRLANAVATFGPQIVQKTMRRRRLLATLKENHVAKTVFMRRVFLKMTIEHLAKETGIHPYWWTQLQRDTTGIIVATTFTPILASELREILQAGCGWGDSGFPQFNFENNLGEVDDKSLENLYEAYVSRQKITNDNIVLELWAKQIESSKKSGQPLLDEPVSASEWQNRFEQTERETFFRAVEPDYIRLPREERTSLENLNVFCESMPVHPSQSTVSAMWEAFRKDRRRRRAAREDRFGIYSLENWQTVFNELDLHE